MRRFCFFLILFFLSFNLLFRGNLAQATDKVSFVLFHLESCPHCQDEIEFIEDYLKPKYSSQVDFQLYEVSSKKNQELYSQYGYFYKAEIGGVPITFIDGTVISGYRDEAETGAQLEKVIKEKIAARFGSVVDPGVAPEPPADLVQVPILGQISARSFSLPLLTVVVGVLDGFNPCAMWALVFLISILLGMENKKRMWLLGSLFILASGLVYFFFLTAWLKFIMFIGLIFWVRLGIGLVAVGFGLKNLSDYWQNRKAAGVVCTVSNQTVTQKTFARIKEIVWRRSLVWSALGIIILGFSVNLVEIACSAGFPAIYTQVLALNDLANWQRYLYLSGYVFFYMLDDLIVFIVAMLTLQSKVVGGRYAKYSNLIGGLVIFVLGLLLLFRPEWLSFR
ncbi:MAG TPA: hypothetical protein VJB37_01735 [Patescibacteria group bacterium]|nr:hypothetical protein [Patescibacteria group bacterium]